MMPIITESIVTIANSNQLIICRSRKGIGIVI